MADYRLHCFPESGGCYKAALMLALCGADWEPVFVDYFNGETRDPEWRERVSEMGEVPVLEHAGKKLTQSGAILHYLADRLGRFGGETEGERFEVLRWILFDNHKFTSYFATYRFMRCYVPEPPDLGAVAFLKTRANTAFGIVEKHLARTPFVIGDRPTIADISMMGYMTYPIEETGYDFAVSHPNMAAWIGRIRKLDGFKNAYDLIPGKRAPVKSWPVS